MKTFTLKQSDIRWEEINAFVLACGNANEPKDFVTGILSGLQQLCTFEQAIVYFFDGNRKVCDQILVNVPQHWSTLYLEYYDKLGDERYSVSRIGEKEDPNRALLTLSDWTSKSIDDFVPNYIRPRGLKYTCSFMLYDLDGNPRVLINLDLVSGKGFSDRELTNLYLSIPHLNNLYKKFFYNRRTPAGTNSIRQIAWNEANLTAREAQIASMLCQGITTANISKYLNIAPCTTYKHLTHIYKKMRVTNKQEFLVKMLG